MKITLPPLLTTLVALLLTGQVVFGQYPAQYPAQPMPVWAAAPPGAYAPPGMMAPLPYGMAAPGVVAVGVPGDMGALQPSPVPGSSSPYHITVLDGGQRGDSDLRLAAAAPKKVPAAETSRPADSGSACTTGGCADRACADEVCAQRCGLAVRFFGEYLYLRCRDAEVPYAVETNSALPPFPGDGPSTPIQTSPVAIVDPDYSSGFRAGFGIGLDQCSEIVATFTMYESGTDDFIALGPVDIRQIESMVVHPSTADVGTGTDFAAAHLDISFDLIDLDYRRTIRQNCQSDLSALVGIRYGKLEQRFTSRLTDDLDAANNDTEWLTDIDFTGVGLKLGLEGEHYSSRFPLVFYARGMASLLAGEFSAIYEQTVQNNSNLGVDTGWKAGRIVPTFDLEVGGGLCVLGGRLRATAGYVFSAWTNVVETQNYIHAVQLNNYQDMSSTITFDGVVCRVEGRF